MPSAPPLPRVSRPLMPSVTVCAASSRSSSFTSTRNCIDDRAELDPHLGLPGVVAHDLLQGGARHAGHHPLDVEQQGEGLVGRGRDLERVLQLHVPAPSGRLRSIIRRQALRVKRCKEVAGPPRVRLSPLPRRVEEAVELRPQASDARGGRSGQQAAGLAAGPGPRPVVRRPRARAGRGGPRRPRPPAGRAASRAPGRAGGAAGRSRCAPWSPSPRSRAERRRVRRRTCPRASRRAGSGSRRGAG